MSRDYRSVSYWLETSGDDLTPRPALDGDAGADVAILGAGYSGLWTAYYLLGADPSLRVTVVEAEIAGFGGSGRNGAWCTFGFAAGPALLTRRYGREAARAVHRAMTGAVDEVGRVCAVEGIDAHYAKDGELLLAVGRHQLPALDAVAREYDEIGFGERWVRLDRDAARARLAVEGAQGGLFSPATATLHPGRLVRGLARAVERRGATIHEQTRVTQVVTGPRPALVTSRGTLRAGAVVLAGESYLTQLPGHRRRLLPISSLVVLTEPLADDRLAAIGWTHRAVVQSMALTVDYLARTADGRILFGGRGAPYHFGSRIRDAHDRHGPTHARLRAALVEWFPALAGVRYTHAWGGPVAVPRDWMPTMAYDPASGVATTSGYGGEGVAASNLGGRLLADLLRGERSELTELPMARHRPRRWEPEPLRWLAARGVGWGARRYDARVAAGRPPRHRTLAQRLLSH